MSLLAIGLSVAAAAHAGTTIVVNVGPHPSAEVAGRSEAKVDWLDADKTDDVVCTECFAALELQNYLRQMTGRRAGFAIVDDDRPPAGDLLLVGGPDTNAVTRARAKELEIDAARIARLGPEGYILKGPGVNAQRSSLVVAGGGRVGTLYAAYDLLYRLGCRWFAPGELHEEIPSLKLERLPKLDVTETPDFFTRGFHAWENRGDPDFLLWMARNRCNYWCVEQSNHPLVRKLGIRMSCAEHTAQSFFLSPSAPYPYDHPTFKGDEKKPKDPYPVGDEFQGDTNNDGKLTYFEAHPEWYAFVNGKRVPGIRGGGGTNYCSSNPHATTEFFRNFVQSLVDGRYKGADIVRFWTLDGGRWCQCPACKALGIPTDRNLLLVHRLDQEIKKARAEGRIHRPIIIRFLTYADVLHPPTRPLPPDFDYDTCSATFFPIGRCFVHNFDDPNCSQNSRYRQHLHGWMTDPKRHYRGQLCIGEYYNVSGFKCLPICFMHTMANDIPYYHKVGARHFHYMHCTTGNWGNKALTNYQMARQLWDVKTDCAALWTDYFARRYGPAAATMRRFYESLEKMLCNVRELKYGLARRLGRGSTNLFPSSHMKYEKTAFEKNDGPDFVEMLEHAKTCRRLIDEVRATKLPERIAARVAEDERLFTYGERTLQYYDAAIRAFAALGRKQLDEARKARDEAARLADLLRDDTTSTKMSSSHGNAADAFAATYATGALVVLERRLGPSRPAEAKAFDPAKGIVVLTGRDFSGGGATRYGYQLHVFPGRRKVSEHGNFIYGAGAKPFDSMAAWFRMPSQPTAPLILHMVGLSCPQPRGGTIAAKVLINGRAVFARNVPFPETKLGSAEFTVPADAFKKGVNRIELRNVEPGGRVGSRPWFGIDRVEIRAKPSR